MDENQSKERKKLEHPYTATIPYNVLNDKELSDGAKLYFCSLSALSKKYGYCCATNLQLAELLGKSEDTIKRYNTELRDRGHIIFETHHIPYKKNGSNKLLWSNGKKIYTYPAFAPKEANINTKEKITKVANMPPSLEGGKYATSKSIKKENKPMLKRTMKKKNKEKTHCSSFQEIKKLMPEADDGAITFWLKTWGYDVVIAAVKLTLSRKNVGNKAGYTRKLLNEGITDLNESDLKNKALAEEYAQVNKAIKVNKYYAILSNDKEIYYKINNQEFENILKNEFGGEQELVSLEDILGEAFVDYIIKQEDVKD